MILCAALGFSGEHDGLEFDTDGSQPQQTMLCNSVATVRGAVPADGATVAFRANLAVSAIATLPFGACTYMALPAGSHNVTVTSSDGSHGTGRIKVVLASPGRAYAVAYRAGAAQLDVLAPSAAFAERLPVGWDRFVWASLCPTCGPVSAFVSDYQKQINPPATPMRCGGAVDETEGPPGPPVGARGAFTHYRAAGEPGVLVAQIRFPWRREQYDGRGEPFQVLLGPNLTMAMLWGQAPVVYDSTITKRINFE